MAWIFDETQSSTNLDVLYQYSAVSLGTGEAWDVGEDVGDSHLCK